MVFEIRLNHKSINEAFSKNHPSFNKAFLLFLFLGLCFFHQWFHYAYFENVLAEGMLILFNYNHFSLKSNNLMPLYKSPGGW